MNKTQVIWGSICLGLAVLLGMLNLVLPPNSIQFYLGNVNMPWIPVIVLGCVGAVLLALGMQSQSAGGETRPAAAPPAKPPLDPEKTALNKRLETVAWGSFLIMLGGFALVPDTIVPKGLWSIGVGLIMLGLNGARYAYKLRMSGFTTILGVLSLLGGIAELAGFTSLDGALLLIILGVYLVLKPWFEQRQLFGKAEHGR